MANLILFEDNAATRELLSKYLSSNGHRVLACRGDENIQSFTKYPVADLILLDLDLGDVSGADLCRQFRALPAPFAQVPILVLSSSTEREIQSLALDIDGYILKITTLDEILLQINRYLEQRIRAAEAQTHVDEQQASSASNHLQAEYNPLAFNLLDHRTLITLSDDIGHEVLLEIMEIFIQDMRQRASSVSLALIQKDCAQIHAHAHALKSSAASYGASQLSAICTNISLAYQANQDDRVQKHAELLAQVTLRTIQSVKQYLKEQRNNT